MRYTLNSSGKREIFEHLLSVDEDFCPKLSSSVNLENYSEKMFLVADRFECWMSNKLVGLIAVYANYDEHQPFCYITNVSVFNSLTGKGVADQLMTQVISALEERNISRIDLHVNKLNFRAINFYRKYKFKDVEETEFRVLMSLAL